jgi:UDP-glucose 4-epimerase
MKYIITGGLGFIGSHLCEFLLKTEKRPEILIIDNLYSGITNNISIFNFDKIKFINEDIRNKNIDTYFDEGDIVIHLAAISSLPECQSNPTFAYDVNVNGTLNILEICRKKNISKIIFASTSAVYENNIHFPVKENDIVSPSLIYSLSKYTCEQLCLSYVKNYNMNICIIRFFNVFGGNQDYRRVSPPLTIYIINELYNNRIPLLHSVGEQQRDYVYIDDLIDLIIKTIESPSTKGDIFNACTGILVSVNEIYRLIKNEMNSNIIPHYTNAENYWNKYDNIISGNNPINKKIIEEEVNKFTLGDNTYSKNKLEWNPKITMYMGIKKMISKLRP